MRDHHAECGLDLDHKGDCCAVLSLVERDAQLLRLDRCERDLCISAEVARESAASWSKKYTEMHRRAQLAEGAVLRKMKAEQVAGAPLAKRLAIAGFAAEQERANDLQSRLDNFAKAGWRACIDHIIKPEHSCPVCALENAQAAFKESERAYLDELHRVTTARQAAEKDAYEKGCRLEHLATQLAASFRHIAGDHCFVCGSDIGGPCTPSCFVPAAREIIKDFAAPSAPSDGEKP